MKKVTITEVGHGFPSKGDYVSSHGKLWKILSVESVIWTGKRPGDGNYVFGVAVQADWSECDESEEYSCDLGLRGVTVKETR